MSKGAARARGAPGATEQDHERKFWIGLRSTYIQQILLIRSRFDGDTHEPDGVLMSRVTDSLAGAVLAIETRYLLKHWQPVENRGGE